MSEPRVTVVLPMFNAGACIAEAVTSILRQSFQDFELLVIDDCSTDAGPAVLKQFADPRLRVLRNDRNLRLPATLNRGLDLARGEYVARMDADDVSRPERLATQVAFLDAHPDCGACGSQITKVVGGRRYQVRYPRSHDDIRVTSLFHSCFCHPTVMLRKSVLQAHGLRYNESFTWGYEDHELWTRLVDVCTCANLPQDLLEYRVHPGQITANLSHESERLALIVYRAVLRPLLGDVSEGDLAIHHRISIFHEEFSHEFLSQADAWLQRLLAANRERGLYEPAALRRFVSHRWAAICGQAAYRGLATFSLFGSSDLSRPALWSSRGAKLFAKCILRKRYG